MILRKIIFFFFLSTFLFSCEKPSPITSPEDKIVCSTSNIDVNKTDNIVIENNDETVLWKGIYTDTFVKINYTKSVGSDGETETLAFVFNKIGNCLQIDRGYKFYEGGLFDESAITKMDILKVSIKDWIINKKITGQLTYLDHHDKKTYELKFWVEFTEADYKIENTDYTFFSNCIGNNLPLDIDLDKDGKADFILGYEENKNTGNTPNFSTFTIKLSSTKDDDTNLILSPKKDNSPYFILFKPPFSSENTIRYKTNVKNTLEVFYEYDAPYQNYNHFLSNKLTYSENLQDNKDDYFLVRMTISGKHYYGWIKFQLKTNSCTIAILDTYLHDVEREHIYVNN